MFRKRECDQIMDLLWPAASHRLKEADLERVERHLESCAACREQAEAYRQTVRLVTEYADQPLPASEATWQSLLARLETPCSAAPVSRQWNAAPLAWSGAVLGAIVLLLLMGGSRRAAPPGNPGETAVVAVKPDKSPTLPLHFEVTPRKGNAEPSMPERLVANATEDMTDRAIGRTETIREHPTHWRHCRRRRLHAYRRRETLLASEAGQPTPLLKTNSPKPMEPPSVDGDRPAVDPAPRQYVLAALASPTEGNTVCDFVMEGVPVSATAINSASVPGSEKEMQAW